MINMKNKKCKLGRNKRKTIKINTLAIIIIFLYISKSYNVVSRILQKKSAIQYIQKLMENQLNNSDYFVGFNTNPNLSIIIPLYNCQNSIRRSIFSVQAQNFKNYEIILINDYSNDNTSLIVNELIEKDKRIKIINNKKNMGILYSRSIGALRAKGKYILSLDNDDIYYDQNLFYKIFNVAESKNYDIVEFKCFDIKKYSTQIKLSEIRDSAFNNHPENLTLKQPELGIFPISKGEKYYSNDYHIWGKYIKTNIYQKAVNILTEKNYSFYNCWTEDISILFIIMNIAKTFIFVGLYGIIHLDFQQTTTYTLHYSKKLMSELFLLDIILKYIQNIETNKKYILQKLCKILKSKYMHFLNMEHKKYLKIIMEKILQIKSLTFTEQQSIIKYQNKFNIK